jgi:acyl-CoA synthetase (AMP-forming)/AMP-acid ligase II
MIIRGNYNIYPSLYESIISSIPGIDECVIFGVRETYDDERIILLIDSAVQNESAIRAKL